MRLQSRVVFWLLLAAMVVTLSLRSPHTADRYGLLAPEDLDFSVSQSRFDDSAEYLGFRGISWTQPHDDLLELMRRTVVINLHWKVKADKVEQKPYSHSVYLVIIPPREQQWIYAGWGPKWLDNQGYYFHTVRSLPGEIVNSLKNGPYGQWIANLEQIPYAKVLHPRYFLQGYTNAVFVNQSESVQYTPFKYYLIYYNSELKAGWVKEAQG
ncbi:MAG: hypothetical protein PWQ86_1765 [Bacillota bacterium]|nr:hypothetical protein [Bacillota bacterium]